MASIYESTYNTPANYQALSLVPSSQPNEIYLRSYDNLQETGNYPAFSVVPYKTQTMPTPDVSNLELAPSVMSRLSQAESAKYVKSAVKQSEESSKYYEKANMANKIAAYTNIAQGAFDLWDTYDARSSVRLTNKQLDTQKELIDLNIKNTETLLADRFRNSIADLQVMYAAKNVDISSQALRSEIVASGEDMGEDIANMRLQGSLQKKAIDFQKSMNKAQQRRNEQQAWINFGANLASSAMFLI